jgi:Zn-dependent protease
VATVRSTIRIARVRGIPIGLHISWFVSAALIVGILGYEVYPSIFPEYQPAAHWALGAAGAVLFFGSILLHELAHSLVAVRLGIPVRGITLFVFGGVSQISHDAPTARSEFAIAVVGPLTSLALAALLLLTWLFTGFDEETPLGVTVEILLMMNLALAIFNLVPGFPMDGGRILRSALWGITRSFLRATRWASLSGRGLAYAMIAVGAASFLELTWFPVRIDQWSGIWFVLVGLFLESSARAGYAQARLIEVLRTHTVGEVMSRDLATIGRGISLDDVVNAHMTREGRACLFVTDEAGAVAGVVTPREVRGIPRAKWSTTPVGDVMLNVGQVPVTASSVDVAAALLRMEGDDLFQMPVVDEGRLIGIVDRVHILQLIHRLRARRV